MRAIILEALHISKRLPHVRREDLKDLWRAALLVWKSAPGWAVASIAPGHSPRCPASGVPLCHEANSRLRGHWL
jgi:hypothetical protein